MTVSVTITILGKTAGKEVVELYLSCPEKSIDKPKRRVKGFGKPICCSPVKSQTITLEINAKDLALFQQKTPGLLRLYNYKVAIDLLLSILKKQLYFH
jgi:beta-glucosidase